MCPNSITPTFTETSLRGKSWTHNHESRGLKRWQVMKSWSFGENHWLRSWKLRTQTISTCRDVCDEVCDNLQVCDKPVCVILMEFNPLQYTGKVGKSVDFVTDTNHESRRHNLCRRLSWFVSATSPQGSFGESRKVGVMEFGLYETITFSCWNTQTLSIEFFMPHRLQVSYNIITSILVFAFVEGWVDLARGSMEMK